MKSVAPATTPHDFVKDSYIVQDAFEGIISGCTGPSVEIKYKCRRCGWRTNFVDMYQPNDNFLQALVLEEGSGTHIHGCDDVSGPGSA